MSDVFRCALQAKQRRDMHDLAAFRMMRARQAEIDWNHSGHWHAPDLPCTAACPASNPRTRAVFRCVLARA